MAGLKLEIVQERPFASLEEEVFLNLLRTSDCLNRAFQLKTRAWGVTSTQYNVLRILRGAQPNGLTCSAIGSRMIAAVPDITRLLARLKALKLIGQRRDSQDRRVLWTVISKAGLALLEEMDPVILAVPGELLGHLGRAQLAELIRLLELARGHNEEALGCSSSHAASSSRAEEQVCADRAEAPETATGSPASEPSVPHPHRRE